MRSIASDAQQTFGASDSGALGRRDPYAGVALSSAQQHALRRSTPLSAADFKAVGRLVAGGDLPLWRLLRWRRDAR